jgi:hypothetical protein
MDKIRPHAGNNVVDDFPLKGKGDLHVFALVIGVDPIHVEKRPVLRQVDPIIRHYPSDGVDVLFNDRGQLMIEHGAVIRQGDVNIGALVEQRFDQSGGYISHSAGLGLQVISNITHIVR